MRVKIINSENRQTLVNYIDEQIAINNREMDALEREKTNRQRDNLDMTQITNYIASIQGRIEGHRYSLIQIEQFTTQIEI